jgi:serine/threonine protein phosphatase 1
MSIKNFVINGHKVKHIFLRGNHEQFILDFIRDPYSEAGQKLLLIWLRHGGKETLDSFDCTTQELVDGKLAKYTKWFGNLRKIYSDPDYVFVHAGIDRYRPLNKQDDFHTLWAFDRNPLTYKGYNKVVVHGHLMRKDGPIVNIAANRIWMDIGSNLFGRAATVCLPEPFDYGYESNGGLYKLIEVKDVTP